MLIAMLDFLQFDFNPIYLVWLFVALAAGLTVEVVYLLGFSAASYRSRINRRLAVAKDQQGQRLGSVLLADALQRAFESANTVGSSMVIVDALDEAAAGFYAAHGFVRLPDSLRLVMPMRQASGGSER